MPTNRPDPADRLATETSDVPSVGEPDLPSVDEIVARLERVRPAAFSDSTVSAAQVAAADLAGQRVGRYLIRRIVGRGSFGVVYLARDEKLGRDVALKIPRPEVLLDEEKLRRFASEAATAATLAHPSIVPLYEADLDGPTPYLASAYCSGRDLGRWLAQHDRPVPIEHAARLVIKLAEAVHYAHRQGVLHRDLKPSNVLLEPCHDLGVGSEELEQFAPRLTDFGHAKLMEGDTSTSCWSGIRRFTIPRRPSCCGPIVTGTFLRRAGFATTYRRRLLQSV